MKKKIKISRARDRSDHFLKHTFLNDRPTTYYYLIKLLYKLLLSTNKEALNFEADNTSCCCVYVEFIVFRGFTPHLPHQKLLNTNNAQYQLMILALKFKASLFVLRSSLYKSLIR